MNTDRIPTGRAAVSLPMLDRQTIIRSLAAALEPVGFIRAACLGGSDATGRADHLSDVDIFLIVERGQIEPAAAAFERVILELSPISVRYRMPMPTWHGFHQAFYQLEKAPEHLMIDWLMLEKGDPHPWFEVERHGVMRTLFDKDGLVAPAHSDREAIRAAIAKKVPDLAARFRLFRHMGPKLAARGLPADAAHFYNSLVLRPLVDMLRAVHCPDRHDYGFRYLKDDLPRKEYEAVCRLCYPGSADRIEACVQEASRMFDEHLARWKSGERVAPPVRKGGTQREPEVPEEPEEEKC